MTGNQGSFDFSQPVMTGEILRNAGIMKSEKSANLVDPGWTEKAIKIIKEFVASWDGNFMAEDVRTYAEKKKDFTAPISARAWGSAMLKAKKLGYIESVGIQPVKNAKAHCANATVWKAC